eukprot:COSAG06_NODE_53091_length_302_cov_0.640394_1_plen_69_part_10
MALASGDDHTATVVVDVFTRFHLVFPSLLTNLTFLALFLREKASPDKVNMISRATVVESNQTGGCRVSA